MAGVGSSAAGVGFAGYAPVGPRSTRQRDTRKRAINYDPWVKDFTTTESAGATELYDAIHPVDQQVVLALTIPLGSLKSAPTVGHRLAEVNRLTGSTLVRAVEDRIRLALKRLIDGQKITILSIDIDASAALRGQLKVATSYQNLETRRVYTGKKAVSTFTSYAAAA